MILCVIFSHSGGPQQQAEPPLPLPPTWGHKGSSRFTVPWRFMVVVSRLELWRLLLSFCVLLRHTPTIGRRALLSAGTQRNEMPNIPPFPCRPSPCVNDFVQKSFPSSEAQAQCCLAALLRPAASTEPCSALSSSLKNHLGHFCGHPYSNLGVEGVKP